MKVLYSWLKEYVDIDIEPKELESKLFSVGFEVEGMEYLGENLEKVVVGQITSMEKYEGTHLQICHVNCGPMGEDHLILTGATNVFVGAKVPAALVGAKLPCGLDIQPRKMVDMISYGMLCSGEEMNLNKDWYPGADVNGIMILAEDAPLGMEMRDYLELDDYLFDISITANRPDCHSVIGIAKEIAAALKKPFKAPDMSYVEDGTINENISVEVLDKETCPRYLGHYIYDVKYTESPLWMKRRLIAVGHNAINAMVDVTNYVLVEIGQPMHAFDLNDLEGSSIVVRRAIEGEKLTTLDEKERVLNTNNLLICDKVKAVGLAGVMGGLNSEIKETTTEVLFESAKFLRDSVRKTARGLGLQSDAASRFEKGIDEYTVECGMARALNLVQKLGIAKVSSSHFDVSGGASTEKRVINVQTAKVNDVLGIEVPEKDMVEILEALQFEVELKDGILTLAVPRYRDDVETYQDIAEEVIREYGYDKVVPTFLDAAKVTSGGLNAYQAKELAVKEYLCSQGYYEIQTIAMTAKNEFDMFLIPEDAEERKVVELLNPITENLSIMRTIMAPSMVRVIENNIKNGHEEMRFFEMANVYLPKALPLTEAPVEKKMLCLGSCGASEDFFSMKGTLESFAGANDLTFTYKRGNVAYLHPGRTAEVYCKGQKIGHFGQLRYEIVDNMNIAGGKKADTKIFIAEIDYSVLAGLFKSGIKYVPESGFAGNSRDISLLIGKEVECGTIVDAITACDELIIKVTLFDLFESEKLGADKKSMAFNIKLASAEKDVTDAMTDEVIAKVLKALETQFSAQMRA
ncbi:MAG: phenylalanine--tRNA ligase subunit beta [Lachnospiraceae bacterium]|nr:phenylalanine--tRNA ligase subunit beta [Lachnospiraceae bacterium]